MNNDDNKTEFFECGCQDRNHLIIVKKSLYTYTPKEGETWNDIDLYLEFVVTEGDWVADRFTGYKFCNFFRRKWWRIKESLKILFIGMHEVRDCWMPLRLEREDEGLVGVSETRRLGEMLIKFANDAEMFYKERKNGTQ